MPLLSGKSLNSELSLLSDKAPEICVKKKGGVDTTWPEKSAPRQSSSVFLGHPPGSPGSALGPPFFAPSARVYQVNEM